MRRGRAHGVGGFVQQSGGTCNRDGLCSALDLELAVDLFEIPLDRARRDEQLSGSVIIGEAIGDEAQDFNLARCEWSVQLLAVYVAIEVNHVPSNLLRMR